MCRKDTIFPSAACIGALVDRFAQHCIDIDIDADTYRQKPTTDPKPPKPPARRRR